MAEEQTNETSTDENVDSSDVNQEANQEANTEQTDNQVDNQSDSDDSNSDKVTKEMVEAIKKYSYKVDGKEFEKELNFKNEDDIIKLIQMAEMGNKRAEETASLKKTDLQRNAELEKFLEQLNVNTAATLSKLGIDVKKLSDELMDQEIEDLELTDEQREIKALQKQLSEKDAQEKEAKEIAEKDKFEAAQNKYAAEWEKELIDSISESELPNNTETVSRMTRLMRVGVENGINLSFKDIAPLVREEMNSDIQAMIGKMPIEVIEKLLGEDKLNTISSNVKTKKIAPPTGDQVTDTATAKPKSEVKNVQRSKSAKEFFANL